MSDNEQAPLTHETTRGGRLARALSRRLLGLFGWKAVGELPPLKKAVIIAAPHTTNWDFVLMLLVTTALGIHPSWMGKHTLFKRPFGGLMRRLGGIPIERSAAHNVVDQAVEAYREADELMVVIPPEGTRSRAKRWKSGFYHIAKGAGVPIALAFVDFPSRQCGIGPIIEPAETFEETLRRIAPFYEGKRGKFVENETPVLTDLPPAEATE